MKKNLLLLLLICTITASAQNKIDVLNYRFEINLNDNNDSIAGRATIRFVIKEKSGEAVIDLKKSEKNGKGMAVVAPVTLAGTGGILKYKHENDKLFISYPVTTAIGDTLSIILNYKGIPTDGLIISKNKFGKRTFFADNWPNRAHNWLPCIDDPADKASVEFLVTAPAHYQVISNGIEVEETNLPSNMKLTSYKEDVPLSTKIMVIGVAEFAVGYAGLANDCIPVSSWVFPENKDQGFPDYALARGILEYFTGYIGPYAFKKLANVQSKTIFGGMENASAIFYFENSVDGRRDQETLFAHEIVHQWFGNMATEKSFAHLWLSEGFATYLTHLYVESKYGVDSLMKRMQKDREEVLEFVKSNPRPVVDSTSDYMSLLNDNSYQKGGWVLHMLRMQLGDSIFHKSIRRYYEIYAGKNADTRDLQRVFENVSGRNLETFFRQWLYTPENPQLDIKWSYDPVKKVLNVDLKQLTRTVFEFPLKIGVVSNTGAGAMYNNKIDKKEHHFSLPFPGSPKELVIDPLTNVLFRATVTRKP